MLLQELKALICHLYPTCHASGSHGVTTRETRSSKETTTISYINLYLIMEGEGWWIHSCDLYLPFHISFNKSSQLYRPRPRLKLNVPRSSARTLQWPITRQSWLCHVRNSVEMRPILGWKMSHDSDSSNQHVAEKRITRVIRLGDFQGQETKSSEFQYPTLSFPKKNKNGIPQTKVIKQEIHPSSSAVTAFRLESPK